MGPNLGSNPGAAERRFNLAATYNPYTPVLCGAGRTESTSVRQRHRRNQAPVHASRASGGLDQVLVQLTRLPDGMSRLTNVHSLSGWQRRPVDGRPCRTASWPAMPSNPDSLSRGRGRNGQLRSRLVDVVRLCERIRTGTYKLSCTAAAAAAACPIATSTWQGPPATSPAAYTLLALVRPVGPIAIAPRTSSRTAR